MNTEIDITAERRHIRGCNMASNVNCVMARAIREALPLAADVCVGIEYASVKPFGCMSAWIKFPLPREVQAFIWEMMDKSSLGKFFTKPRAFRIAVPQEVLPKEPVRPSRNVPVMAGV